jgi:hypothetical protein
MVPPKTSAQIKQQCRRFLHHLALRKGISPLLGDGTIRVELRRRAEWDRFFDEGGRFLSEFHWDVFATPSFKHPVTGPTAHHRINELVEGFGGQAYAAVAYEVGPIGLRLHAHMLVGGLNTIGAAKGSKLWHWGNIDWQRYDPKRGAAWYLMKTAAVPDTLEIIGEPKRWHPRRRKRGRGRTEDDVRREGDAGAADREDRRVDGDAEEGP